MTKDSLPLVSIGMPVRNCRNTVGIAIKSLLDQTFHSWELLLIDDGSSDGTQEIVRSYGAADSRIEVMSDGRSRGLVSRLNQAIELSKGLFFARMDGDDVAYPERLERQVNHLKHHPDVDLVGTWALIFGAGGCVLGKRTGPTTHHEICAKPLSGFPMMHPTYMGRTEWFRRYGYRQEATRCEDQDMLFRSYRYSTFADLPEILLGYREERIDAQKILLGRRYFAQALFTELRRQDRLDLAMRVVIEQALKGMVDGLAVLTGLDYKLLRHRAQPFTAEEEQTWKQVWREVNRMVDDHGA